MAHDYCAFSLESREKLSFEHAQSYHNWVEAMNSEYNPLLENNTWTLQTLPRGKRALSGKWVFRLKSKQ
jgi:hypothetical protein